MSARLQTVHPGTPREIQQLCGQLQAHSSPSFSFLKSFQFSRSPTCESRGIRSFQQSTPYNKKLQYSMCHFCGHPQANFTAYKSPKSCQRQSALVKVMIWIPLLGPFRARPWRRVLPVLDRFAADPSISKTPRPGANTSEPLRMSSLDCESRARA
ncbi:hypothetical protein VTN31DRAFT_7079 [Thermomyces dupontii]|uniref:uncharacterized protein n=1 Tax=Talaromyces thermophilus TaxID=28565 RepID=UPI0037437557